MAQKITVEVTRELELIVPRFLARCQKRISSLQDALQQRDFTNVRTIGHHLKGAGGGYGFPAITDFGARIEQAAEARDHETIALCLDEFAAYLGSIEVVFV